MNRKLTSEGIFFKLNSSRFRVGFLNAQSGQSLVEVIVAIGIAAVFLGAGVAAISPIIKSNLEIRTVQSADSLAQNYIDKLANLSESNWTTLYNLSKGSGNNYMLVASGTQTLVVQGEEASPDNDVTYGLVGHWNFDEATGTQAYDFSGNGNGGTLTNGPIGMASSSCALGNCLSFDGSSNYIRVNDDLDLRLTNLFTIAIWVKSGSTSQSQKYWLNKSNDYAIIYEYVNDAVEFFSLNYTGTNPRTNSGISIADTNWHHIVYAYNGTNWVGYKDGNVVFSVTRTFSLPATSDYITIGSASPSANFTNGLIDDTRIYNRALSAAEVKQLYSNRIYARSFTVDNVNRDSCGVGSITADATSTCSSGPGVAGVADDPSTQKITVNVSWSGGGSAGGSISKTQYLTRTSASVFSQTDWSGGDGQEGPITSQNNQYATSTGIDYSSSTGSIIINGY